MLRFFISIVALITVVSASQRPSIFNMPGVDRPPIHETQANNPCYQKLISAVPKTGQIFADVLFDKIINDIRAETLLPTEQIREFYATTYPGKSPLEIISIFTKFSQCVAPADFLRTFKSKIKEKYQITLTSDTLDGFKAELTQLGYEEFKREPYTLSMNMGNNRHNIMLEILTPNDSYFNLNPTGYIDQHSIDVFTPDSFFRSRIFAHAITNLFENHNINEINTHRKSVYKELLKRYSDSPQNINPSDYISFKEFGKTSHYLEDAEKQRWNLKTIANQNIQSVILQSPLYDLDQLNRCKQSQGNFSSSKICSDLRICNNDRELNQECGSVVINEEPIHEAYHKYLAGKSGLNIVDLGSSIGFNSIRYTLSDDPVTLCDRSIKALIAAGAYMINHHPDKLAYLKITTQSAANLKLPENSVDVVFMGYLIKYFSGQKIDEMLQNIFDYLKPGGKLFLVEITNDNEFYNARRQGTNDHENKVEPFPTKSPNWSGEIGQYFTSHFNNNTKTNDKVFQYDLTQVSEQDVIEGLKRAGFTIEKNMTTKPDGEENFNYMPAIQIIATKPLTQ